MNDRQLFETRRVEAGDFNSAGDASAFYKNMLKQLGVAPAIIRRIAIAAYEAELNMIIHSLGGELRMQFSPGSICIEAADDGPGIEQIDLAMQEGYSTASDDVRTMGFGAGMGLPNMRRCADDFQIESQLDRGTSIRMYFHLK